MTIPENMKASYLFDGINGNILPEESLEHELAYKLGEKREHPSPWN